MSQNVFNALIDEIKAAIDRLEVDQQFNDFLKDITYATTTLEMPENAMVVLQYACNKVAKDIESIDLEEINDLSLLIIAICTDDKKFILQLNQDKQLSLALAVKRYLVDDNYPTNTEDYLILCASFEDILNGLTFEEIKKKYELVQKSKHALMPYYATLMNVLHNSDQTTYLDKISKQVWSGFVDQKIESICNRFCEMYESLRGIRNLPDIANSLIYLFKDFDNDVKNYNPKNMKNPQVGKFLHYFIQEVDNLYDIIPDKDILSAFIIAIKDIYIAYYHCHDFTLDIINQIFNMYTSSDNTVEPFTKGVYLEAINMYLNTREDFQLFREINPHLFENGHTMESVFTFMDPIIEKWGELIANEAISFRRKKKEEAPQDKEEYSVGPDEDAESEDDSSYEDEEEYDPDKSNIDASQSTKGYKKGSSKQANAQNKIYKAYAKYKNNEQKVDSQLEKMLSAAKRAFTQDKTEEIIEGKRFTPIGLLKKILMTAAVFSYSKIAGFIYLLTGWTLNKKRTDRQRQEILMEINTELKLIDEKIDDARGDGNRKAKYALMRTKAELERARDKIRYGLSASKDDMKKVSTYLNNKRRDNL